jgi:hypothetical protein
LFPDLARAADAPAIRTAGGPKRVIFFLQNHGFDPFTCIPKGLTESCPLGGMTAIPNPNSKPTGTTPCWRPVSPRCRRI